MAENTIAAFIDFDGTLLDGYLWRAVITHHRSQRFKRWLLFKFLAVHLPMIPLWRLKIISRDWFYKVWGENMAWLFKGVSIERAEMIWHWLIDHHIQPNYRTEILELIRNHRSKDHTIVLLSGAFEPLLTIIADQIGAQDVLGTPLEVQNGSYTGRIVPPLNIGQTKKDVMSDYAREHGVDLSRSYCYTDSIVDLPALEIVGFPVAVYPDEGLDAIARFSGWQIISQDGGD